MRAATHWQFAAAPRRDRLEVMQPLRRVLLWGSQSRWLAEQARQRGFARRAVSRFMPGEDLDAALTAAHTLAARGMGSVLTHLGENVAGPGEAEQAARHYLEVLDRLAQHSLPGQLSVKLTHLGLGLDGGREACAAHLARIADRAAQISSFVWIDMESSAYTDATLELYRRTRAQHRQVGVCLQAYLHRTAHDLEGLLPLGPAIRLVKGAYNESAAVAFPRRRDVDANFFALAQRLLASDARRSGSRAVFGTHDVALIRRIRERVHAAGLPADAVEWHLLYGVRTEHQRRLAADGDVVRVLISYGSAWFPWYMRRLAERPANLWFVAKAWFA